MDLLALLENRGFTPKKSGQKSFVSGCPVCGDGGKGKDSDRFHIWPDRQTNGYGKGKFWCRMCGITGDSIAFLQKVDGMTFPQACGELGIILPKNNQSQSRRYQPPPSRKVRVLEWRPNKYQEPPEKWQEKAGNLLADCRERLAKSPEAIAWLQARGITSAMADTFKLGFNLSTKGGDRYRPRQAWGLAPKKQGDTDKKLWIPSGHVIPCFNAQGQLIQLRIRRRNEDIARFGENIKYLPIDGSSMATMVLYPQAEVFVIVESGFDAILLAGLMGGKVGAMTNWNSSARPDVYANRLLSQATMVLGALDYDQGGDREQGWWQKQYATYRRLPPFPGGEKDPGDAYAAGVNLRDWLIDGMPRGLKIKLGYTATTQRSKTEQKKEEQQEVPEEPRENETTADSAIEMTLSNGTVIYVTDNQDIWRSLTAQGKPVFSRNEIERLKEATATMTPEERLAAAMQAVEVKSVFGGYIKAGRTVEETASGEAQ